MESTINNGTEIYELVEEKMVITPVGIIPLDLNAGYFFLSKLATKHTHVYEYRLSIFEKHDEKYRGIRTDFVHKWLRTVSNSPENIKHELIRNRKVLPNPAGYNIETELAYPLEETLLPIAKRCFVKYLSGA